MAAAELPDVIRQMLRKEFYPHPTADRIQLLQTHVSYILLTGTYAYKVKKPVDLGFLDFSTLERRRHFCEEEVRLNRRLAPQVYLGVVPVARSPQGLRFEGTGEVVDWAVKMQRLPEDATLREGVLRGQVGADAV